MLSALTSGFSVTSFSEFELLVATSLKVVFCLYPYPISATPASTPLVLPWTMESGGISGFCLLAVITCLMLLSHWFDDDKYVNPVVESSTHKSAARA